MKHLPLLLALLALTTPSPARTPGGKSLAELVRERFEEKARGNDPGPATSAEQTPPPTPTTPPEPLPTPEPAPAPVTPEPTPLPEPTPAPEPEPEPEPPAVAAEAVTLPEFGPEAETYQIKSGDTLGRIAGRLYGSSSYATLLQNYNKVDPRRLRIGQALKTPALAAFMRELAPGTLARYPAELQLLLEVHAQYSALEERIGSSAASADQKKELAALQEKVAQLSEGLNTARQGVSKTPSRALTQLKSLSRNLEGLAKGSFSVASKQGKTSRTHLALALSEIAAWEKKGFR